MAEPTSTDIKARLAASYDAIAPAYAAAFTNPADPTRLRYIDLLISHLQQRGDNAASVLELGCGAGIPATKHLLEAKTPVLHVTGNDISSAQIALARENLAEYEQRLTLVPGDMMALSFSPGSFHAITGFYSIIHLPRAEQTQLLHRIATWLKPGGFLLANFAVQEAEEIVNERWLGQEEGWMYWSGWGEEGSVGVVESVGLSVLSRERWRDAGDAEFVWVLARKGE